MNLQFAPRAPSSLLLSTKSITIEQVQPPRPCQDSSWPPLSRGPFLWVLLILIAFTLFGIPVRRILQAIASRIESGEPFDIGKIISLKGAVADPLILNVDEEEV